MEMDLIRSHAIARAYFGTSLPLIRLGWGVSGFVYLSPDSRTAVKIHRRSEGYYRELEMYLWLRKHKITEVNGFTIPKIRDYTDNIIQMDFVSAPYLLDFAGAHLSPPSMTEEALDRWHRDIEWFFGPNAWLVHLVHDSLRKHGIYYLDFRPSNLNVSGHPNAEPPETLTWDDL
jgi:hypothetical protein